MQDNVKVIQEKVGLLINWVSDMKTIVENPYANGLNLQRVLTDLEGFAADLNKSVYELDQLVNTPAEEPVEESKESKKA